MADEAKVVVLGDTGVGKTSIVLRFVQDTFSPNVESTIGATFKTKTLLIGENGIKFQIWDTAGQERYHSLASVYYRGAHAAIIVYDITDKESFASCQRWVDELRQFGPDEIVLALCGNKSDLDFKRQVSNEDANKYAESIGATLFETSAKTNEHIGDIFNTLGQHLVNSPALKRMRDNGPSLLDPINPKKQKKLCC